MACRSNIIETSQRQPLVKSKCAHHQIVLQAAADGDCSILRAAPEVEAARCTSGCTALHWAAGCQQEAAVRYLICERDMHVDTVATKKSSGRTALHYACRNGHLEVAKMLVYEFGASVNARAKHGVTPFQLAVWRNHLDICQWLVEDCGVDSAQVNDFGCGAAHWLGISPIECADSLPDESLSLTGQEDYDISANWGYALLPMARWLATQNRIDFHATQHTGHTSLHKAAWLGHLILCKYLHTEHDMWDDSTDQAGNYAADLADMANTPRHAVVAEYLRAHCSRAREESCKILGVSVTADHCAIREAYKRKIRLVHPDKQFSDGCSEGHEFLEVRRAYQHLIEEGGRGSQSNPAHSLSLMLQVSTGVSSGTKSSHPSENIGEHDSCFKARLIAVLLEYGGKGLNISNLRRKWNQVWPNVPFPGPSQDKRRVGLTKWIRRVADDVVIIRTDEKGGVLVFPKHCTRETVAGAAIETDDSQRR